MAQPYGRAFRNGLRALGWIEGCNVTIEERFAEGEDLAPIAGCSSRKRWASVRTALPVEWQDWLVDEFPDQETTLAASEEFDNRRKTLAERSPCSTTVSGASSRRAAGRRPDHARGLSRGFDVSRERVRQIEVRAFEKVQKAVKNRVAAMEKPWRPCWCISFQLFSRGGKN